MYNELDNYGTSLMVPYFLTKEIVGTYLPVSDILVRIRIHNDNTAASSSNPNADQYLANTMNERRTEPQIKTI